MGQPYGRSQAQGNKPRPSQQLPGAKPSQPQKKHFAKPTPPRDPAQTASVIKTRAFKLLVNAAGAENLALALDSNLSRITELGNGERFTPETAFHMETTLGLPHGFSDQPYPVLTPEVTARLRSPLDNLQKDVIAEEVDDRSDQKASASSIAQTAAIEVTTTRNHEMAPKAQEASATSPSTKKGRRAGSRELTQQAKAHVSAKVSKPSKSELQQSLELAAEPSVPEIRRANLHVLTARNGSKALLSRLLNLDGAPQASR